MMRRSPTHHPRRTHVVLMAELVAIAAAFALSPADGRAAAPAAHMSELSIATVAEGVVAGSVDAGESHSCGVRTDGTLACWGWDFYGQADPPAGTFTSVSAGGTHSCGVKTNGKLTCWGNDDDGQADPPSGTFTSVSAGQAHSCGVRTDGTLACWGRDDFHQAEPPTGTFTSVSAGQLHSCGVRTNGTLACWSSTNASHLISPLPTGTFRAVSAGRFHSCALRTDGTLACWGRNVEGQSSPPAGTFTAVSAGSLHNCAVKTDGTLACWGLNLAGDTSPPAGTFTAIAAGGDHSCGVKTDGTLACWGANLQGQSSPPAGSFDTRAVDGGSAHSCGVRTNGTLACWGWDDFGQSDPPAGTFTAVSAGGGHSCGIKTNGTLACWGLDAYGEVSGAPAGTFTAVSAGLFHSCGVKTDGTLACWGLDDLGQASPPAGTFTAISAGDSHSCGVKADGTLACWGYDGDGRASPPAGRFAAVSAGGSHSCGLETDGTLACWGLDDSGQSSPPAGTFTAISAGGSHSCGVRTGGTLACWGLNDSGQSSPPAGTFTAISAGGSHSCAVRTNGTLACWGSNSDGQLGAAPDISSPPPPRGNPGEPYTHTFTSPGDPDPTFAVTAGSLPPGLSLDGATGVLSGTPTAPGHYGPITVTASNEFFPDGSQTFTIVINSAPVATDDAYATTKGAALSVAAPGVLTNDTDFDGDQLTAALVDAPGHGTVTLNANGSFTYTPDAGFAGSDSFTYRANDGSLDSNLATVTFTVTNTAPVAQDDVYTTHLATPLSVPAPGVLANDTDADGDPVTAELAAGPSHGTLTLNADGSFSYTSNAGFTGSDSFTYRANDGTVDSNLATVTLTVTDTAPVTQADSYRTHMGVALSVPTPGVLGNDTDADGDPLTAALASGPSHGTLTLNSDGSFDYTPNPGFSGRDSFTYTASDGALDSDPATVTLAVSPVNDDFADRITLSGRSGSRTGDTNVGATKEPGEPNHPDDPGGASVWYAWTAPSSGTVTIDTAGSDFDTLLAVYTGVAVDALSLVAANDDGPIDLTSQLSFQAVAGTDYKIVVDGFGGRVGSVHLHWAYNSPPVASDDAYRAHVNMPLTVAAPGVLANDSDVDGDPLTATLWTEPSHGTLTLNANGSFVYTPEAGYGGDDGFSYLVSDGSVFSNVANVTLTVTPVNDDFGDRITLPGATGSRTSDTNVGGTKQPGEPNHADNPGGASVWYHWRAPTNGVFIVETAGSDFDTLLAAYTGNAVNALTLVMQNDNVTANDRTSKVGFSVSAATDYKIAVDGFGAATGAVHLHWSFTAAAAPPPPPPQPPPPPPPPPSPLTPPTPTVHCLVPKLKGKTLAGARRLLASRHCRLGGVTRAYSAKVRRGRVVSQRPRAGLVLAEGTKVKVLVSRGRRPHHGQRGRRA
jgi:VCBS repeat-containing protein